MIYYLSIFNQIFDGEYYKSLNDYNIYLKNYFRKELRTNLFDCVLFRVKADVYLVNLNESIYKLVFHKLNEKESNV